MPKDAKKPQEGTPASGTANLSEREYSEVHRCVFADRRALDGLIERAMRREETAAKHAGGDEVCLVAPDRDKTLERPNSWSQVLGSI